MKKYLTLILCVICIFISGCTVVNKQVKTDGERGYAYMDYRINLLGFQVIKTEDNEKIYHNDNELNYITVVPVYNYQKILDPNSELGQYFEYFVSDKESFKLIIPDECISFFDEYEYFILRFDTIIVDTKKIDNGEEKVDKEAAIDLRKERLKGTLLGVKDDKIYFSEYIYNEEITLAFLNEFDTVNPKLTNGMSVSEFLKWFDCIKELPEEVCKKKYSIMK